MRITFEDNRIEVTSNHHLEMKDGVVFTYKKLEESSLVIKGNKLDMRLSIPMKIEEVYLSGKQQFNLVVEDDLEISSVILVQNDADINKKVTLNNNDNYIQVVADLFGVKGTLKETINIEGENSYCYSKAACVTRNKGKNMDIEAVHNAPKSASKLDNYGVVLGDGNLVFNITGSIAKKCVKSDVKQNNRIILFDKESTGSIEPMLYIDENDVAASHAAAVGKVDDNHIFYLCSRGLDEKKAKIEIAKGYIAPVLEYVKDEDIKNKIEKELEVEVF